MPSIDHPVGHRRRLILDAAILLGTAAAAVLVASMIAPVGPTGGVLGITTDGMATAGTVVGAGPLAPAASGPIGGAAAHATPVARVPAASSAPRLATPSGGSDSQAITGGATGSGVTSPASGVTSSASGPSAASLALLAPCPDHSGCYLYVVRRGDNLTRIASRFGLSVSVILALNPAIVDPSIVITGSTLRLPAPTR